MRESYHQERAGGTVQLPWDIRNRSLDRILLAWTMLVILISIAYWLASRVNPASDTNSTFIQLVGFATNLILGGFLLAFAVGRGAGSLFENAHLTAMLILMVLLPMLHLLTNTLQQDSLLSAPITPSSVTSANLIVFGWYMAFAVGSRLRVASRIGDWIESKGAYVTPTGLYLQTLLGVVALVYLAYRVGAGAFTRLEFESRFAPTGPMEALLVQVPAKIAPVFAWVAVLVWIRRTPRPSRIPLYVLLLLLSATILVFDNPLAAPRYWTGAVVIGISAVVGLFKGRIGGLVLSLLILLSLLLAAPSLNVGRHESDLRTAIANVDLIQPAEVSYGSFPHTVAAKDYVDVHGSTRGRQLLGAALFWVPRSTWPTKPTGSGTLVATSAGQAFTNIDMPLPAEGLINFGFPGVLILGAAVGALCRSCDACYARSASRTGGGVLALVLPFFLGMVVFATRGDLLSSVAFATSMGLSALPLLLTARWRTHGAR